MRTLPSLVTKFEIIDTWKIALLWSKDVGFAADTAPVCDGYALVNFAILRTIAINLLRQHGFASITQGIRRLAHDSPRLFSCLQ